MQKEGTDIRQRQAARRNRKQTETESWKKQRTPGTGNKHAETESRNEQKAGEQIEQ
jgi:hypothetical protein